MLHVSVCNLTGLRAIKRSELFRDCRLADGYLCSCDNDENFQWGYNDHTLIKANRIQRVIETSLDDATRVNVYDRDELKEQVKIVIDRIKQLGEHCLVDLEN